MSRNQIEFANLLCHFGPKKVMLDYLNEIVAPAFTNDTLVRQRGKENPTSYHFYQVEVKTFGDRDGVPIVGISGEFIKRLNLTRTQIFDEKKGLVESPSAMESAPSAYFLLILNNHKIVYLPKTQFAPTISEFGSTISNFIKNRHKNYIDNLHKTAKIGDEKITKTSLYVAHPSPTIDVVSLATKQSIEEFIRKFEFMRTVTFRLARPNPTVDAEVAFNGMQGIIATMSGKSGVFAIRNNEGLNKSGAQAVVAEAALAGTNDITIEGQGSDGITLSGSNDDFKARIMLDAMPVGREAIEEKMMDAYDSAISTVTPDEAPLTDEQSQSLKSLAGIK